MFNVTEILLASMTRADLSSLESSLGGTLHKKGINSAFVCSVLNLFRPSGSSGVFSLFLLSVIYLWLSEDIIQISK